MKRVSPAERERIIAALRQTDPVRSIGSIAREFGRSISTVLAIRDRSGVDRSESKTTEAATGAAAVYREFNAQRRREVIAKLIARVEVVAEMTTGAQALQQLATATGILVDKMRLEENKASTINEERGRGRPVAELSDDELRERLDRMHQN
jgi:transposase-like protein